ncbi:hypothetical protein M1M56_gp19 [uncultured phage cr17_1]|jgi:hypothetical protein|uniref:Uncharacterized protein n=1 Tax=uncultured phage cr17_1 TaxID=2986404 RepID=A0AAE7RX31_9CAUD|nr:hypothetical protein M1M56_gp19 [uncultured phage cr17_1]QWM90315.1 hypothetical protein [uncultured phage cr17_1]DAR00607.1 MAG TPA: hypothetical protein [Crassvirales sp.]
MYIIKAIIDNIEQYYCGEIYKESEIEFNSDINLATKFSVYFIVNLKVKEIKFIIKNINIQDIKIININENEIAL